MSHRTAEALLLAVLLGGCGESVVGGDLVPSTSVERSEPLAEAPVVQLSSGFNEAGFELWRSQPVENNFVFSPMSIGHALLMARAAADDTTGRVIDATLALPDGLSAHQAWNAADQQMADAAGAAEHVTLNIADRIWPRVDLEPDRGWIDLLLTQHGASTQGLDFVGDPVGSREVINGWVGQRTEGLIPELLPEGFISAQTLLVLTDAIYFKARWETVFGKYPSEAAVFTRLDGSTTPVELMRELELDDRRGVGDGFVGAELPYVGGEFSMLILVPDDGRFDEIRDRLSQEMLDEIDSSFSSGPFELLIPRWEATTSLDLLLWMEEIGAAPGNYPLISEGAFLGAAVHAADIAVDEWGTVAAAATALGFEESGPPEPELTVKADRPFFYLIRHRPSGMILFSGQVTDPTA